jgi:hypothetical protein
METSIMIARFPLFYAAYLRYTITTNMVAGSIVYLPQHSFDVNSPSSLVSLRRPSPEDWVCRFGSHTKRRRLVSAVSSLHSAKSWLNEHTFAKRYSKDS